MRNIYLIFRRDYLSYVSAWGFWAGLLALPVLGFLAMLFMAYASQTKPVRYYTVIEQGSAYSEAIDDYFAPPTPDEIADASRRAQEMTGLPEETIQALAEQGSGQIQARKFVEVAAPARSIDTLRPYLLGEKMVATEDGPRPLFAAIIVPDNGDIEYWSSDVTTGTLRAAVRRVANELATDKALQDAGLEADFLDRIQQSAPKVLELRVRPDGEKAGSDAKVTLADRAPTFAALGMAYVLWLMIFSVIQYLLMGTIEERSNKIFDTLLTSVRMPQLIIGKLLAVFAVTMTMMGAWGVAGGLGTAFAASAVPGAAEIIGPFVSAITDPALIIPAFISFALGYVMYGVIFMALGSLCDTIQEAQTLLSPMMVLLMLPMLGIIVAFNDPTSPLIGIASWVPIFTPFLLILRMPHDPPMWEIIAQMALMAVTAALMVWGASKIYRAGAVNGASIGDLGKGLTRLFKRRKA